MAYKFQFGTTKLSGSTTFEEALVGSSTISGSGLVSGKGLVLDSVSTIGTSDDSDLLTLSANTLAVAGALSASGQVDLPGAVRFGTENQLTVTAVGLLSGSATATLANATLDRITAGTADINGGTLDDTIIGGATAAAGTFSVLTATSIGGALDCDNQNFTNVDIDSGAIDGTTVGASSQSSVKATTLSASSTLHVAGASNLGVEAQTTVSAVGLLSSSATATLANATFDRITAQTLLGDMSGSGGLDLMGAASFGNARLVVNENALLFTGPVHVSGTAFAEENITVANVADSKSRLAFYDIDSGEMKTTDFKVYADVLAGTGITATAGVLSVDTTGGDSMSATHITLANYGNATLTSGLNYMTSAVTGAAVLKLPSGSAGDVVVVKAPSGVTSTNYVKITSSLNKNEIDGFSQAVIESEYGAVSLMWAESDGKWIIY